MQLQVGFPASLKGFREAVEVLCFLAADGEIIDEHLQEMLEKILEDVHHHLLECSGHVVESEWHPVEGECPPIAGESCLEQVLLPCRAPLLKEARNTKGSRGTPE